jgi:hypothetical protein
MNRLHHVILLVPIKTFNQLPKAATRQKKKKLEKLKSLFQASMRIKILSCWNRDLNKNRDPFLELKYVTQKLAKYKSQLRAEMSLSFKQYHKGQRY